ncbi:MAG: hypothetical protein QXP91_10770, partial [Candidatus Methanomethylicia archaeon]
MNRKLLTTLIFIFLLSIVILKVHDNKLTLKIIVVESGKVYSCNVNAGDKIVLHYIHSIYMKDIYEVFEVNTACEFILKEIIIGNNSYTVIEPKDLEDCYMNAESFIIQNLNIKL